MTMDKEGILALMSEDVKQYADAELEVYNAPFARDLGIEITFLGRDHVKLYLDIVPKHINSRGFVHGAVIYGLIDHSLAFAANMAEEAVGQSSNIIYHRPLQEGRLEVETVLVNRSRSLSVYDSKAYSNGKLIASATLTAFRLGERK